MNQGEHQGLDRRLKEITPLEEQLGFLFLCFYFNLTKSFNLDHDYYKFFMDIILISQNSMKKNKRLVCCWFQVGELIVLLFSRREKLLCCWFQVVEHNVLLFLKREKSLCCSFQVVESNMLLFTKGWKHYVIGSKCWDSLSCCFINYGNRYGWFQVVEPIVLLFSKG